MNKTKCTWKENDDGAWDTSCHNCFELNEGGPAENDFKFCPYCGGSITVRRLKTGGGRSL